MPHLLAVRPAVFRRHFLRMQFATIAALHTGAPQRAFECQARPFDNREQMTV